MKKFAKKIKEKAKSHASIPFWSWNDKLDPEELKRQIRNMHDMKMQGFFMHARSGLETEYMKDEWYECIEACIDEAKRLGMQAWSYDENGWPSGFAGGELLTDADNHACFVDYEWHDSYPERTEDTLAVYAIAKDRIPTVVGGEAKGTEKYLLIKVGYDESYVDTMREDITDKFIAATHEKYKERLGADFGGAMPGFFTDEPQYYRWKTPYSRRMAEWFFEEYGYSVLDALPALFCDYEGAAEHRYDYHRLTNKKFTENFAKRLYEWHDKNGVKLTGHFVQEDSLAWQMVCAGDIMPLYLYQHIPGVDNLGRYTDTELAFKQLGSVAAQTGREFALSETFACCGWDVTPRELRRIAEMQYAGGVNLMCQHLYPYSIRGQRKRDYPAFYSEHSLWQRDLADFNEYFNNLGALLSEGDEYADVLVLHPIRSAWLHFQRIRFEDSVKELDDDLLSLINLLGERGVCYHFGSETIMRELAAVEDGKIRVGKCLYDKVIIPACETLDKETVALLSEFINAGGSVYTYLHKTPSRIDGRAADIPFVSALSDITDDGVIDKIKADSGIVLDSNGAERVRMMVRSTELGRLVYITNLAEGDETVEIFLKNADKIGALDVVSLEPRAVFGGIEENGAFARLIIPACESVVLFEKGAPEFINEDNKPRYITLENNLKLKSTPENQMTLDRAYVSLNGNRLDGLMPIERIRDELLFTRFAGRLTLAFPFEVKDIPESLRLVVEPMKNAEVRVNGSCIPLSGSYAIDRSFRTAEITDAVRVGENLVEIELDYYQRDYVYYVLYGGVSEALRNCLVFDTEIECVYLLGDFAVQTAPEGFVCESKNVYRYDAKYGMPLIRRSEDINAENITLCGYPFYSGELTFTATLNYKAGDPTALRLLGRYMTARIRVNGKDAGKIIVSNILELRDYLVCGENDIEITICNNYRNLLGPHHNKIAEPKWVAPKTFSFEGAWRDGACESFDGRYALVRFGIDFKK